MYPQVAIQICTYDRYNEIQKTVKALQEYINYPKERITLYVCDDNSPNNYTKRLARLKPFKYWDTEFLVTEQRGGWGANVNNGLHLIKEEFILFVEDDYVLARELPLWAYIAFMQARTNIGMLRLRGTSGSHMIYHQFEADISEFIEDTLTFKEGPFALENRMTYLQLDSGSHDLWLYSHGPHLKRRSFHRAHGLYPEGRRLGETEEVFAHVVKDNMRTRPYETPAIAIFPDWLFMQWDHIGTTFQGTELDT